MKHDCTCDHPRYDHGFCLSKVGCFRQGCSCEGIPDVSHETKGEGTLHLKPAGEPDKSNKQA